MIEVSGRRYQLYGIETPVEGACGYDEATSFLADLIGERPVSLLFPYGSEGEGATFTYLEVDRIDAGLAMIEAGLATAIEPGDDEHHAHPRENQYLAADERTAFNPRCT